MYKVAILLPTKNRPEFVIRQLRYYASVNSPHPVYIGDASDMKHAKSIEHEMERLRNNLTIHYFHSPNEESFDETLTNLMEESREDYCVSSADDDMLVPQSLTKCARFLDGNSDYRTAQGKAVLFRLKGDGAYGEFSSFEPYWLRKEATEDAGAQRLLNFGRNYWVPQLSVHRRGELIEDSEEYKSTLDSGFSERIHCHLFIVRGKSKFIDCLYLIRQNILSSHPPYSSSPDRRPGSFDWLISSNWQPSCGVFVETVANALTQVDGISSEEAIEIVKLALWYQLNNTERPRCSSKYVVLDVKVATQDSKNSSTRKSFRERAKDIPGARTAVRMVRSLRYRSISRYDKPSLPAPDDELSLPALLKPSSKYHEDFLPFHEILTKKL